MTKQEQAKAALANLIIYAKSNSDNKHHHFERIDGLCEDITEALEAMAGDGQQAETFSFNRDPTRKAYMRLCTAIEELTDEVINFENKRQAEAGDVDLEAMIAECDHDARKMDIPSKHIEMVIRWVFEESEWAHKPPKQENE